MDVEPGRRHPVHMPVVDRFNRPIIIFLTICSKDRKNIFARGDAAGAIVGGCQAANSWLVGRYVIMPDHIHLFCAPNRLPIVALDQWVKYAKNIASRHWPRPEEHPVWERHFWDTQLRDGDSYDAKWDYVVNNPVRAGLVEKPEDWPYHGELNILPWFASS